MKIAGLVKTSLIDYPGNISAVIFTYGCNLRCPFCHNPDLITGKLKDIKVYPADEIIQFLEKRKGVLDGVVITGGEPLLHNDLEPFIKKIKELGFKIKLDTNGTNPEKLRDLISLGLIDFIAMDIKNSPIKYAETVGVSVDAKRVNESIKIIMDSEVEYEFRSTVLPRLHSGKDFHEMGEMIRGAKKFVLQGFRPGITLDKKFQNETPFKQKELMSIKKTFQSYIDNIEIRDNI